MPIATANGARSRSVRVPIRRLLSRIQSVAPFSIAVVKNGRPQAVVFTLNEPVRSRFSR
jgi:hypothetical protein